MPTKVCIVKSVIFPISLSLKSLQSCPTLCDPIDGSPLGSSVPRILQARILEWVAISFSSAWKWKVKLLSRVRLLVTPWTAAYQAPLSMGFSRQEYWNGVPLPSPVFPIVMYECESWTINKAEHQRIDAFELLLNCSTFFMIQLSHPFMTTGKTIAWTRQMLVGKVMSLLLVHCLGWLWLFFQGVSVFQFHGCSHHLQWFWSPGK